MYTPQRSLNILKSVRGNTLVGLMVGLAIVEITGTAMVGALGQFNKQSAMLDAKNNGSALVSEMSDEVSKLATCQTAMDFTTPLTADGNGNYPISMTVPSLPYVLLTSGSSRILEGYGVSVKRLYFTRLTDTGLKGALGKPLFAGELVAQFESSTDGSINMRSQTVSQMFLEIENSMIKSCSSGDDPTTALAMACSRVHGEFDQATLLCSMDTFSKKIVAAARAEVNDYLKNVYTDQVLSAANVVIQSKADIAYSTSVAKAAATTDQATGALNSTIATDTNNSNNSIANVNNTLNQNRTDLWNGINNANAQSNYAQALTNNANANSDAANGASASANNYSSAAQGNAAYAIQVANNADANSAAANNNSNQAYSTAQSSYAISNQANGTIGTANYYSANSNNVTNIANGSSNWANATSSSANNYATSAYNAAAAANNAGTNAVNTAAWSNAMANDANNNSNAANNMANNSNTWSTWALQRPGQYNQYYSYVSQSCLVGGPSCAQQN